MVVAVTYITVGFSHDNKDFISRLMAWLTHGKWSHVVLINPDNSTYIEASGIGKPGVREKPLETFLQKENHTIRRINHPYPLLVWELARNRLGREYDWLFLLSHFFRMPWIANASKDVCSEIIYECCLEAGHNVIPADVEPTSVTPHSLYLVSEDYQ